MKPELLLGAGRHQEILELLSKEGELTISGVSNDTAKALLLAQLYFIRPRAVIIVGADKKRCDALKKWATFFEMPILPGGDALQTLLSFYPSTRPPRRTRSRSGPEPFMAEGRASQLLAYKHAFKLPLLCLSPVL